MFFNCLRFDDESSLQARFETANLQHWPGARKGFEPWLRSNQQQGLAKPGAMGWDCSGGSGLQLGQRVGLIGERPQPNGV